MQLHSIAFIPDGNRRYANKKGLLLAQSYALGFSKAREVIDWSFSAGVREATIWTLSTENLERNRLELRIFLTLLKRKLADVLENKELAEKEVKVRIVGRLELLPRGVQELAARVMESTSGYSKHTVNLCVGYGGRAELIDAFNTLSAREKPVTEKDLRQALYLDIEPDLIIRTGNTQRLSGFLPWQSAYSELYFSEKLWPEFTRPDFDEAVKDFYSRQRRFGR